MAIFYTLFVGFAVHRELSLAGMLAALRTTTWITGRVLLILFTAVAFGRLLVEQRPGADRRGDARDDRQRLPDLGRW